MSARSAAGQKVAILDAGAQYGKVIDRRVRELHVESDLLPFNTPAADLKNYGAIILSGGPQSVFSEQAPKYDPAIFKLKVPMLGICYGFHLINTVMGGTVATKARREDGPCTITVDPQSLLFSDLEPRQNVLMSHGDSVDAIAPGFTVRADSDGIVAAIENPAEQKYAVQFHPEVDLTEHGKTILKNFLFGVAKLEGEFTLVAREKVAIEAIQKTVGEKQVLVLLSGGVDSTVCAALLRQALKPSQIIAMHIDHGFMRLNESQKVIKALEKIGVSVKLIDARERFAHATTMIKGVKTSELDKTTSPEEKRKIIGDTFVKVAEEELAKLHLDLNDVFLVQGTLRPDLIESASSHVSKVADTIKTHHNDTQLIRDLRERGRVIEPLSEYHKDEVRELGMALGLPAELVWRQPFPGPGLAIRVLCADKPFITDEYIAIQKALAKFATKGLSVVLLPARTVGVQGDGRTYSYIAGLSGKAEWSDMIKLARQIPKEVHQINRVVYIFGEQVTEVPAEITPTYLIQETVKQLQIADEIVNQSLLKNDLIRPLSQVPVILFPVNFGQPGKRSIAIRTFITNDFMTGVPAVPGQQIPVKVVEKMAADILKKDPHIARVVYDLTSKPPGTTEWE